MTNLEKLSQLKEQVLNLKGLNSTERNRKQQIVKTITDLENKAKQSMGGRVALPHQKIAMEEIETQAMFIKKSIGQKGAKGLVTNADYYKSFKTGQRNAKERESISERKIREATPGTDEARLKNRRIQENRIRNNERYLAKQKEAKHIKGEELKFIQDLVAKRGYHITEFRNKEGQLKAIQKEFKRKFVSGKRAVFKNVLDEIVHDKKSMSTIQSKLDKLQEVMRNDPNFIRNYARFEENFFNKVLIAMYDEIKKNRSDQSRATLEEINDALNKAIKYYEKLMQGVKKKGGR